MTEQRIARHIESGIRADRLVPMTFLKESKILVRAFYKFLNVWGYKI